MADVRPLRASVICKTEPPSSVKFIFCGLSQFSQNMGDFALHVLAWCLINHMCDFSSCNNSLDEGWGGDRAAEQESDRKGVSRHVVLRMVDSQPRCIYYHELRICLRCTPSEQKPPPISKDPATQFEDTPKLTSARSLFRK